jgi:tetratricopeptide (TPR) repeat protein
MDREQEKMQDGSEFLQVLRRYEEMIRHKTSYFFDVGDFEDIIDYFLDIHNFRDAMEALTAAEKQHPDALEIRIKRVHVYLESGKAALAMELLEGFPSAEKETAEFFLLRGSALAQLGKIREAEKDFDLALDLTGEDTVEMLINISIAFENSKQYRQAVKYLRIAFSIEPENHTVLYDLGYYYERLHNYSASIDFYNRYLDLDPFSENVWYNLGVVYFKTNRTREAIDAYDYAIAINPSYASAYFNKANIYANDRDYQKAIAVYHEFISLEPNNIQAWCYIGECYEEINDYPKALEIYKKVIGIENTYSDAWLGAAVCYLNMENPGDALVFVLKAIELDPENPEYYFALGEIYEKSDALIDALNAYANATRLDPEDREAWVRQALLHVQMKEYSNALECLRDGYQHNFNTLDFVYLISAVYFLMGDEASGLLYLEKGLAGGEGALKLFFQVYPAGKEDERIQKMLRKEKN